MKLSTSYQAQLLEQFEPAVQEGLHRAQENLGGFLGQPVRIEGRRLSLRHVLDVNCVPISQDTIVTGICINFTGDLIGYCLLIFDEQGARDLMTILLGEPVLPQPDGTDMATSALMETGNLVISGFLCGLADWAGGCVVVDIPMLAYDSLGAVVDSVLAVISMSAEHVVVVETTFEAEGLNATGHMLLLPFADEVARFLGVANERR